ncbi:phage terminase small subunit P27 family [Streptomyces mutabilis]|uniref:phage terminase small subunit P27 family n=1 Tax=Streptomyces mutabilis TaxID=67332 RepID=UPI003685B15E
MSTTRPIADHMRSGTFRADRHADKVTLPPAALIEPDWDDLLPGDSDESAKARSDAAALWARTAPVLMISAGLTDAQREALSMFCVAVASYWSVTRELSRTGNLLRGRTGELVKNPLHTVRTMYVNEVTTLRKELGLSPAAAARITRPSADDEDYADAAAGSADVLRLVSDL